MTLEHLPVQPADPRIVVLENRMTQVESGIASIIKKLDERSSINWAPVSILVTVLSIIGGMGFTWINAGQGELKASIAKGETRMEAYVPRIDLDTRFSVAAQRRDDLQRLTDARVERAERDIDAMQKATVPRGELEQTWAGQRQKDDGLQRQIDALRRDLGDLNTPRDTIQSMQRRIDQLEAERRRPSG